MTHMSAKGCLIIYTVAAVLFLVMMSSNWINNPIFSVIWPDYQTSVEHNITLSNKPKCGIKEKGRCYGQCCEDHRIFERFFSNPVVCNGTYVELGATNGVRLSNTKFFEDLLGWNGLLIEGNPSMSNELKKNRPKSIIRDMAICKEGETKVNFTQGTGGAGGVLKNLPQYHINRWKINTSNVVEVPCVPMGKLLREAGITSIDLFSLDVEGSEMVVLETMDWSIPVKYFIVEMTGPKHRTETLKTFLENKGFRPVIRKKGEGCGWNTVFENVKPVRK